MQTGFFWDFNFLKSSFLGFWVIQTGYWPDLNLEIFFLLKEYLFMKNLTDFHKTVEAGVDPRLIVKFLATHWAHQLYSYLISSNNSLPSINRLPRIITPLWRKYLKNNRLPRIFAPLPVLSPSSLPLIPSLSGWSAMRFSKTDQWRFQLWKLIKELNLEH